MVVILSKIMIIEDDKDIAEEIGDLLQKNHYEIFLLEDFSNPISKILEVLPDLVLLDINLPYQNGESLLQELRKESNLPVIMLTSKNTEIDEALSISYGADDYITKPFSPNILLLRIGAVLKRVDREVSICTYKDLRIYFQKGVIKKGEEEVILTKNETIIFSYLYQHQNQIVSRDELMTDLWNNDEFINDNALTVTISRLRSKLKSIGCEDMIDTRKGIGYILS